MISFRLRVIVGILALMPAGLQNAAAQGGGADPATPIAALDAGLISAMHAGRTTPFAQRYQNLAPIVMQAFDLQAVLQAAVGLRWAQIPSDQQHALMEAFTRFTVSTYVANFDSYGDEKIEISGTKMSGTSQIVQSRITANSSDPAKIDYVMRQNDGRWRAVDVLLDGNISRAAVLRSDFRSLLVSGGPAALIADLDRKSDALAAGGHSGT